MVPPLSKETIAIVEKLAYRIHEIENQTERIDLNKKDRDQVEDVFFGLKSEIGRFFMRHLNRREKKRPHSDLHEDYLGYWGIKEEIKNAGEEETAPPDDCVFCGSVDLKKRHNNVTGKTYWYCNNCRQENRTSRKKPKK